MLRARIAGLRRFEAAEGEVIDALVERIAVIFGYAQELRESHLRAAPTELTVEIDRLGRTQNLLNAEERSGACRHAPAAGVPAQSRTDGGLRARPRLAVCDVGGVHVARPLLAISHPRLGWVKPVTLHRRGADVATWPIGWRVLSDGGSAPILEAVLHVAYVDYAEMDERGRARH